MSDAREPDDLLDDYFAAEKREIAGREADELAILRGIANQLVVPTPTSPPSPTPKRAVSALAAGLVLAGTAAMAATTGYVVARRTTRPEHTAPSKTPSMTRTVSDAAPLASAPSQLDEEAGMPSPPMKEPPGSAERLEPLLINHAQAALRRQLPSEAYRVLVRHRQQFPNGQLREERDVLLMEVLVTTGRTAEARAAIASYRTGGRLTLADRVDALEGMLDAAAPAR